MKLTIDTKHDSHEDIKKVIGLLQHMVNSPQSSMLSESSSNTYGSSDSFSEPTQESSSAFMNIFGDSSPSPAPAGQPELQETSEVKPEEEKKQEFTDIMTY